VLLSWQIEGRYLEHCTCAVVCLEHGHDSLSVGADDDRCRIALAFSHAFAWSA